MEPGQYDPAVESKKLRDDSKDGNREETESDQCTCRKQQNVNQFSLSKRSDEVGLEQKRTVIDTGIVSHDAPSQPKIEILDCQRQLKDRLKEKYSFFPEGMLENKKTLLKNTFTELQIMNGGSGGVNKEHDVREIETECSTDMTEEEPICCNQLFLPQSEQDLRIRTVITRGVAGIGKTVSTNKFILDWAEGKENTNLDFVFPVPFEDLNKMREPYSLVKLLSTLFSETKRSEIFTGQHKMLFILDGLEESQLSLDFNKSEIVTDVTQETSAAVLLINIIRGRLLPSALVWIISRPEACDQIPLKHVDLVIEVKGFNNAQKDEYFRKKIGNQDRAERVITHVKSCRSLHIMCHIPVFCWMLASVLDKKLSRMGGEETPLTLTPVFIQYLTLFVENMKTKLPEAPSTSDSVKNDIISLGKLAFEELEKGQSNFEKSDLVLNGIKVTEPSLLSGIYTQIFSEDLILLQEKMFSFVHLYVQEFFAALYVYHKFNNDNENVLIEKSFSADSEDVSELNFFKAAVEKSLQSENRYFDIFLRFLLGLSLESNQKLLKYLNRNKTNQKTRDEIIEHIKERIRASPSPDRCRNLRLCLNELGDYSMEEKL